MIFVTVGNMDPFDRLIRAVDAWAAERTSEEVFVQIGSGRYRPQHCRYVDFLAPIQFRKTFAQAEFVVSHAGMGTIITALELAKPLVVMPKRASLGEQRNEHQLATVRRFRRSSHVRVAENEDELHSVLAAMTAVDASGRFTPPEEWRPDPSLIGFVRDFIWQNEDRPSEDAPHTDASRGVSRFNASLTVEDQANSGVVR